METFDMEVMHDKTSKFEIEQTVKVKQTYNQKSCTHVSITFFRVLYSLLLYESLMQNVKKSCAYKTAFTTIPTLKVIL